MKVKKCCGFVDIRPGLGIWALLEIISAGLQFIYFKCVWCSTESLAVVGVDSVVGIVASSLLLYGVICKRQKCAISLHLLSRIFTWQQALHGYLDFCILQQRGED